MLFYHFIVQGENVLPLVVIDHVEVLQSRDDVLLLDGRRLAQLVNGDLRLSRNCVFVGFDVRLCVQQNLRKSILTQISVSDRKNFVLS